MTKQKEGLAESLGTTLFLILALGFFLIAVLPYNLSLNIFRIKPFTIASNSMAGVFEVGDVVVVAKTDLDKLERWDIISFKRQTTEGKTVLVTHYIADILETNNGRVFKTKSNITSAWDNWDVAAQDVVGKAVFKIPYLGQLALALRNPLILLNSVIVVVLMYLGYNLVFLTDKKNKAKTGE